MIFKSKSNITIRQQANVEQCGTLFCLPLTVMCALESEEEAATGWVICRLNKLGFGFPQASSS